MIFVALYSRKEMMINKLAKWKEFCRRKKMWQTKPFKTTQM